MKNLTKGCLVLGLLLMSGYTSAALSINPFIGGDYYYAWMLGKGVWRPIFPHTYQGTTTIYVGARIAQYIGIELGGDYARTRTNTALFSTGSLFFNTPVPIGQEFGISATVKRRAKHVDLIGYYPLAECLEVTGHLGVNWIYPKITLGISPVNSVNLLQTSVSAKSTAVCRVGVGLSYMVTEWIGLRAKFGYETTSKLRIKGNAAFNASAASKRPFHNSTTASIGIFGHLFNSCCP